MNTRSAAMVSLLPTYRDVRSSAERSRTHEFYTSSISSHRHQVSVSTAGAWKIMADLRMPAGISQFMQSLAVPVSTGKFMGT
jgi:hypothetical protein